MRFPLFNRVLVPGILAGSVIFVGTACSRPDRGESGTYEGSTVVQDSNSTMRQPSAGDTAGSMMSDTTAIPVDSGRSAAPKTPVESNSPRAETAAPSRSDAAGYRPMDRDTGNTPEQHADSARVTADTAVDTAAAGYVEMARDTSTAADQVDTDTEPSSDSSVAVSVSPDTTDNAGRIRPPEDSTEILGQVTTNSTEAAVTADSSEIVRVRPPEDSTEILGNVTNSDDIANETADEQIVNPDDQEKVAASEAPTDEVGAAAVTSSVTGADAVALVSREGVRCTVVDPETNEAVRWDMSSTPVTLNPCGLGSMNLSKIWSRVE